MEYDSYLDKRFVSENKNIINEARREQAQLRRRKTSTKNKRTAKCLLKGSMKKASYLELKRQSDHLRQLSTR